HDGRLELLLGSGISTQVLGRDDDEGWGVVQEIQGLWPLGLGDADGDGQVDLWMLDYASAEGEVAVFLNDGEGEFDPSQRLVLAPPRPGCSPFSLGVQGAAEQRRGLLWAPPWDHPGQGYEVTSWNEEGAVVSEHLAAEVPVSLVRYAGDFDQDGDVDLIVSDELVRDANYTYRGLSFLLNQGDGTLERVGWDSEVEVPYVAQAVCFRDLNQDGHLDLVAMDSNLRQPAVVVGLGQETGVPVLEGRYPLPEGYGGPILAGDVDGDGDPDLVVLEPAGGGTGGVHVLLSRLSDQGTAVGEGDVRLPSAFHLGPNYPNPFNPQTWIPLEIPASTESARLRVYNLMGQPIRTLVSGRLTPGYHAVPWDGRDERGQPVSSGVYLYRLEAGAWRATGKMMRSE
ncbi:MAG: FG-GAP-like repeat-containing protein, partial [Candidatus Latescibacterota bacterium]